MKVAATMQGMQLQLCDEGFCRLQTIAIQSYIVCYVIVNLFSRYTWYYLFLISSIMK